MSESDTKPCPKCAKPLRPDAANCWFCGVVFGIVRCVECGSPNRTGSPACQICGEPLPSSPLLVAASDSPPTAPRASEQDCPGCGGPVPLAAIQCKHCGTELNSPACQQADKWSGATVRRSRGGVVIAAGIFSFLFPLAGLPLGPAFFGRPPLWVWFVGFGILGTGLLLSTFAVVRAFLDVKAMKTGRIPPDGMGITVAGGLLAGLSMLLHWFIIGYCIFSLL